MPELVEHIAGKPRKPILLFDVMGTLVVDPFFAQIPAFFELSWQEFLQKKHPTAWVEFEYGQLEAHAYYEKMFSEQRKVDNMALESMLFDSYCWIDGMEECVKQLHGAGYELHAFSNYPVWYQIIERKLQLSRYLSWTFVSCNIRQRKPDPEAYRHVLSVLQVPGEECVFVDDRSVNCHAAEQLGIRSVVFEGQQQFVHQLAQHGVTLDK
jgi:FMN hydrolase / 5-amino-6-(5-phospho-D-ribitylamino)uracil phosphatase